MTPQLRAGAARCDITPPVGIAHGNWSAQVHERAEAVDLPLSCTVLAISDGAEDVLIAEWELLYPPTGDWLAAIHRRITELTGVPASHIRISSTHTHSGPSLSQPWFEGGAEMVAPYLDSLTDRLAGTCLAAQRRSAPRAWAAARAIAPSTPTAAGRTSPAGPCSPPTPTASPTTASASSASTATDGRPIAILVNYAAHPTILAWDNRLISTDYPGTLRRTLEGITGGLCLFRKEPPATRTPCATIPAAPRMPAGWVGSSGWRPRAWPS